MPTLRLGVPKGSLESATISLFDQAGWKISPRSRNYYPSVDDPELTCALVRAQEMARYVEQGVLDAGITGHDWVSETEADVVEENDHDVRGPFGWSDLFDRREGRIRVLGVIGDQPGVGLIRDGEDLPLDLFLFAH